MYLREKRLRDASDAVDTVEADVQGLVFDAAALVEKSAHKVGLPGPPGAVYLDGKAGWRLSI